MCGWVEYQLGSPLYKRIVAVSVDMFMLYCDVMRPALRLVGVIECVGDGGGG